jgi:hypothetical protein
VVQAFMRLAGLPYHVCNARYPAFDSTGELPQLQLGKYLVGRRKAMKFLLKLRKEVDAALTPAQLSDVTAFSAMVQGPMYEALVRGNVDCSFGVQSGDHGAFAGASQVYCTWAHEKQYESATRKQCRASLVAPLRWILPDMYRRRQVAYVEAAGLEDLRSVRSACRLGKRVCGARLVCKLSGCISPPPLQVQWEVSMCYKALEKKLGKQPYFFGDTCVRVCVYGVWCVVCGVWCVVCGVWCVVCGVWCVVCGVVCGVWCGVCVCVRARARLCSEGLPLKAMPCG